MAPNASNLPRFPISIILSYLQQPLCQHNDDDGVRTNNTAALLPHNRDALAFLLTTKKLAYAILPLFRVPRHACRNYQCQTKDGRRIAVVEKYRFMVFPIQDSTTLLDRLNTRRLRGRISWMKQMLSDVRHMENNREEQVGIQKQRDTGSNNNNLIRNCGNARNALGGPCYQYGRTIEEMAFEEWTMMVIHHPNDTSTDANESGSGNQWRIWPAHLELLRFLDCDSSKKIQEHSNACHGNMTKQKRGIPSLFSFQSFNSEHKSDEIEGGIAKINLSGEQDVFGEGISLISSYPRSGNTLLRTLLERITSIVTGSDTRPDRLLSKSLALDHDLVGEGLIGQTKPAYSSPNLQSFYQNVYDPLVHIVKTHFPERKGWKSIKGNRVLLLVRNPFDAIDSYWNLCCTNTHTRSLDESVYEKYAQKFEGLARHEIQVWCDFHYYWIDICEKEGVPLLVVRYEDLVLDTESEMLRIMKFLMGQRNGVSDGEFTSFWEWRIRHAIGKSTETDTNTSNLGSYQPRSSNGGLLSIGKSIRKKRYSESVLNHMHYVAASVELERKQNSKKTYPTTKSKQNHSANMTILQKFGYDINTQQFPENFKQPPEMTSFSSSKRRGTVAINKTLEIRKKNDPFGRAMTFWRRGETDNDTKPFPTVRR